MKILVISDSHGNITNLKHVVGFGKKIGVGAIIHAGDWNTVGSVEAITESKIPLYTVLGNADIDPKVKNELKSKGEKFDEDVLFFELGGRKILISHYISKLKNSDHIFDIGFHGHRHTPEETTYKGIRLIRPGALEKNVNFVVYDTDTNKIEFLNDKA